MTVQVVRYKDFLNDRSLLPDGVPDWVLSSESVAKVPSAVSFLEHIKCGNDTLAICPASSAGPQQPALGREVFLVAGTYDTITEAGLTRHAHARWFWPKVNKGRLTLENGALETLDILAVRKGVLRKKALHFLDSCFTCIETPDRQDDLTFGLTKGCEIPLRAMQLSAKSNYMRTAGYYLGLMLSTDECEVDHANWHRFVTMNEQTGKAELDRVEAMSEGLCSAWANHVRKPFVESQIDAWLEAHPEYQIG